MSQLQNMKMPVSPMLLKQCEAIIEGELENLKKLFRALEVIEQMELYTEQYDDFESYCQDRWKTVGDLGCQGNLALNLITKDNK